MRIATERQEPARILHSVLDLFDEAGIRHCILHGWEDLPDRIGSDVDMIVERRVSAAEVVALLRSHRATLSAEVVQWRNGHIVLASRSADAAPTFLALDLSPDVRIGAVTLCTGEELLRGRRRHGAFWAAPAALGFACYLARSLHKRRIDDRRATRLAGLFAEDPAGCEREVGRFWPLAHSKRIIAAARAADWAAISDQSAPLWRGARNFAIRRNPMALARNAFGDQAGRLARIARPDGLYLALLGPDGAGKSSSIEAMQARLAGAFSRSECYGFTPGIVHRLRH